MPNILTIAIPRNLKYVFARRNQLLGFKEQPRPVDVDSADDSIGVFHNEIVLREDFPYIDYPGFLITKHGQLRPNPPTAREFVDYFDNVGWCDGR